MVAIAALIPILLLTAFLSQGDAARPGRFDPLGLIAARSPGERGDGPLILTKGQRVAAALPPAMPSAKPTERVLSAMRYRDPGLPVDPGAPLTTDPAQLTLDSIIPDLLDTPAPHVFVAPPVIISTVGTIAPTVVSSVPEPGTWVTLLAGFAAIGVMQRRRNAPRQWL
jgi:hypothetical protein